MKWKNFTYVILTLLFFSLSSCTLDAGVKDYEQGVQAYNSREYKKAAECFAAALEKNSDRAEYYLYYGFALMELGEYRSAAYNFEKVIQDKDIDMIRENNKQAYRAAGIAYYMEGENAKALENFYAALQLLELPDLNEDIRTYMMQANAKQMEEYRIAGELSKALAACDNLLEEYGASADLYRIRADIFMEQRNYESALKDFDSAIEEGDKQMGTLLGKLQALQSLGRESEAQEVFAQIAAAAPENDEERMAAATALFAIAEYDTAEKEFLSLYQKGVKETGYYLAQIAAAEEDYAAALGYLEKWEKDIEEARDAELYYQIAFCCLKQGEISRAAEYYEKLERLQDASFQKKQEKLHIVLLEQQGRWEEALSLLEQYMGSQLEPGNAEWKEAEHELAFLKSRQ